MHRARTGQSPGARRLRHYARNRCASQDAHGAHRRTGNGSKGARHDCCRPIAAAKPVLGSIEEMMAHDTPWPIGRRVSAAFLHSSLTRRVNTRAEPTMIQSQSPPQKLPKIFLSSTIWAKEHRHGVPFAPGRQHYSYEIARRKFEIALHHLDREI